MEFGKKENKFARNIKKNKGNNNKTIEGKKKNAK